MIEIVQSPFSDPDQQVLHDWLNQPGRLLWQRYLSSQAAEKMAEAANETVSADQNADAESKAVSVAQAKILNDEARVLVAARKMIDEVLTKDVKFYLVELKPEPPLKNQ